MEAKGKELFGENFMIYKEDHHLIFKLLVYMIGDAHNATRMGVSLNRGILLSGPIGCGKTALLTLLRDLLPKESRFVVKSCRVVTFEFIQDGYSVILKYGNNSFSDFVPKTYLFDDLGAENNLKYYGNDCNVMAEILLSRYDLFISQKMITHITTNLNSEEIDGMYGPRVRSRMREMFNLFSFDNTTKDRRK
jgi:DNA replication protein DnaC